MSCMCRKGARVLATAWRTLVPTSSRAATALTGIHYLESGLVLIVLGPDTLAVQSTTRSTAAVALWVL
jgi:hypothetical protein